MKQINCNQIGYLISGVKRAVLRGDNLCSTFQILNEENVIVYRGKVSGPIENKSAEEVNFIADFSDFKEEGIFTLKCGEDAVSYPFLIGESVYSDLMKTSIKMLYLQRCGMKIEKTFAGDFAHATCHMSDARIYGTEKTKEVRGGWHDAGDYGRYVGPGAVTVADLFLAYEDHKDIFLSDVGDAYGIPESGNGIPDILDEAKYELEWMLKMQDLDSGGVYHKVTCETFPGFIPPEEETEELVLSPISTTATGAFAAIMAKSYVIYKELDSKFAERCLIASEFAWEYLEKHPNTGSFKNPPEIVTGEYDDEEDADERFWAAAELLRATGELQYGKYIETLLSKHTYQGFGWADIGTYANITCLRYGKGIVSEEIIKKIENSIIKRADELLLLSKEDGYGISLGDDYIWGSNMVVCNQARELILANEMNESEEYKQAIADHFHYILGMNPMSVSYVTGFGTKMVEHPHHRMSVYKGKSMPGMVIGGPDAGLHDPAAEELLKNQPPAKCFVDHDQSYSTNEITIYWNSPFIYLLANIMSK